MMLFTHLLAGVLVGLAAASLGGGPVVVAAGLVGGLLPDLDMFADHRRTLHFPVGFAVVGIPLAVVGHWLAAGAVLALGTLFVAAWVHSVMDVFGSARELRPWERTSDEAVYNHLLGRWHGPRRLVYDGSPGDLLLCGLLAAFVFRHGDPVSTRIALALLVPATIYALARRWLAGCVPAEYDSLSPFLKARVRAIGGRILG